MQVLDRLDAALALSEPEAQLVEAVKRLSREKIAPTAAHWDATGEFPWANVEAINELGLNAMFVPEAYGGAGLSLVSYLLCAREIASACASTGIVWSTNFHALKPLIDFGTEEQKRRLLPKVADGALGALCITEPTAGSDATGMRTRFRPDGDEIVIDGQKTFITNGDVADIYVVFGKWSEIGDDRGAISVCLVEKGAAGLSVLRKEDKMGLRGSSTCALAFEGVRVPRANLMGEPGGGLALLFGALNKSRPSIAAHALGIARAALSDAADYINQRTQSRRRIVEFQGIQFMLADHLTDLASCEALLWYVAKRLDAGDTDVAVESSMVKMRASDLAMRISTDAVQLFGGYGYTRDFRVERLMRDAKITQIWEGTNQVHRQVIGRSFIQK